MCQLDTLGKCRNKLKLRDSLARLPPTLDETYNRILCAIDKEDSEYARRILQWLAFSSRPLRVEEVAEVIAINTERNPAFNIEEVLQDPLDILTICSSLVTITMNDQGSRVNSRDHSGFVTFAHYSVKEYLLSQRILQSRAERYSLQESACNEIIARGCIGYLLQFHEPNSVSAITIRDRKLATYAANFWIAHTQAVTHKADELNHLIIKLFSTGDGAFQNWVQIYNPDRPGSDPTFRTFL